MAANVQDVVMLFGDSITQGAWEPGFEGAGAYLAHVYARKLDVLNRGFSGYNTDWAAPIFEQCLVPVHERDNVPAIKLLTIWFGANDACLQPSPQHVPLDRFAGNLRNWIDLLQSPQSRYYSPDTRIILISPPPVNSYQRSVDLASREPPRLLDRDFGTTRAYAQAVKEVAEEKKVGFTDVWGILWQASGENERGLSRYLYDGLHLNKEGYKLMYDGLMTTIKAKYPEVHPDNLSFVFPPWLAYIHTLT